MPTSMTTAAISAVINAGRPTAEIRNILVIVDTVRSRMSDRHRGISLRASKLAVCPPKYYDLRQPLVPFS